MARWSSSSFSLKLIFRPIFIVQFSKHLLCVIHLIPKAWSEHGVEALWTGQKDYSFVLSTMRRLYARSRLLELGACVVVSSISAQKLCFPNILFYQPTTKDLKTYIKYSVSGSPNYNRSIPLYLQRMTLLSEILMEPCWVLGKHQSPRKTGRRRLTSTLTSA